MAIATSGLQTLQDAATATGNGTVLDVAGFQSVVLQITGTFVGTITYECNIDGATWVGCAPFAIDSTTRARALTDTGPSLRVLDLVAGLQQLRARISAYTSGSITVKAVASA